MTATQSTGTDTGALQLLDAIQATPVSSPGLEGKKIGTQDLEGGQLVGSNCSTTCKGLPQIQGREQKPPPKVKTTRIGKDEFEREQVVPK